MKKIDNVLALVGAVVGGLLGHFIFFWVARQGFYGLIIPGAAVGLGASFFNTKSKWVPIACGLIALVISLFTEWRYIPFEADDSFGYFLFHFYELTPITLFMIAAGAFLGFWIPFGSTRQIKKQNEG